MSWWTRIARAMRGERLNRELDEEMEAHMADAVQAGCDPEEVRRRFGSQLRHREASRDHKVAAWLDALRADSVFGWRQLWKNRVASGAAIVSLALAMGACAAAFRLLDALVLRPLPIAAPERLYLLTSRGFDPGGSFRTSDSSAYPLFQRLRAVAKDQAELISVSYAERREVTYRSDDEMERANWQFVSGWMFSSFGLKPALGRLLTENDDQKPGGHPVAVLSHSYWVRRFGGDAGVLGQRFRMGNDSYEVVGVAPASFHGTETGIAPDIYVPSMMNPSVVRKDSSWFRTLVHLKEGVRPEPVVERLRGPFQAFQEERAKGFGGSMPPQMISNFLNQTLLIEEAGTGRSAVQQSYAEALWALGALVVLVLLIACVNVANLMTVQAAARSREMAVRVSIGAGRRRLVQLVLVESAWLALLAACLGAVFAWWSAPFVVSLIATPDNMVSLHLPVDWRVFAFGAALLFCVVLLFGTLPAWRASAVKPVSALKGGEPHSRRRLMHGLIAAQVAFCVLVLFVAGLFATTLDRVSHRPVGFTPERLLVVHAVTRQPLPLAAWNQAAEQLQQLPGVESVAQCGWSLLDGNGWNGFVFRQGLPVNNVLSYYLSVSPGWLGTMKIPLLAGRDFRPEDAFPGATIVNESFVRTYLGSESPLGKVFEKTQGSGGPLRFTIVGVVADTRYRNLREPLTPIAFVPRREVTDTTERPLASSTFIIRTASANPMALAQSVRQEIARAQPGLRVDTLRTQTAMIERWTIRERLLAILAAFFAGVALLLAGVGLFGVLNDTVSQRRREIGIRLAIGAPAQDVVRRVVQGTSVMVLLGAATGIAAGFGAARWLSALLFQVRPGEWPIYVAPTVAILLVALMAALRPALQAVRIDPAVTLRND